MAHTILTVLNEQEATVSDSSCA